MCLLTMLQIGKKVKWLFFNQINLSEHHLLIHRYFSVTMTDEIRICVEHNFKCSEL